MTMELRGARPSVSGLEQRRVLGARWKDRGIKDEKRAPVDTRDKQRLQEIVRQWESKWKLTDASSWAEWMFLEAGDKAGGVGGGGVRWFGDRAKTYLPTMYDDVLRRTDAIVLLLDRTKRRGIPLAVDVATQPHDASKKFLNDNAELVDPDRGLNRAYWHEVGAPPGSQVDSPKEGTIETLHATVYLPRQEVETYMDVMKEADAKALMKDLGPFVRRQLIRQLQFKALLLLDEIKQHELERGKVVLKTIRNPVELTKRLTQTPTDLPEAQEKAFGMIREALATLEEVDRSEPAPGRYAQQLMKQMPTYLRATDEWFTAQEEAAKQQTVAAAAKKIHDAETFADSLAALQSKFGGKSKGQR